METTVLLSCSPHCEPKIDYIQKRMLACMLTIYRDSEMAEWALFTAVLTHAWTQDIKPIMGLSMHIELNFTIAHT